MIVARTRAFPLLSFREVIQTAVMFLVLHLTNYLQKYYKNKLQHSNYMGNSNKLQESHQNGEEQFQIIQQNFHDHIMLIGCKTNKEEYLGKTIMIKSKEELDRMDSLLQLKTNNPNSYISKIVYYNKRGSNNFCNLNLQYSFIFQKGQFSLKQETYNRKFKFQQFQQTEILLIIQSVIKGLLYLKGFGQKHKRICSQNIFIRHDRSIFFSDPWLYSNKQTSIYKMNETGYIYPSPQKILFQNDLVNAYDEHLSDYYSLGILALELTNMEPMDFIYEKGFRRILEKKLVREIEKIKRNDLKERVKILVSHYPQKRREIQKYYGRSTQAEEFIRCERELFKQMMKIQKQEATKNNVETAPNQSKIVNHRHENRTSSHLTISNYVAPPPKITFVHKIAQNPAQNAPRYDSSFIKKYEDKEEENGLKENLNHLSNGNHIPFKPILLPRDSIKQSKIQESEANISHSTLFQVNSSLEEQLNQAILDNINHKHQFKSIKEAQSINVSEDKSEVASQVIGHGFSAKNSLSIGIGSKPESFEEVRSSMPTQSRQEVINEPKVVVYSVNSTQQVKKIVEKTTKQCEFTPDRKPSKKKNHSTIKEVSEESPSIESHSFDLQQRTIEYDVGTKYIGQIKNGKRNGKGIFYFQDGSFYEGSWKENKMHGKGSLHYTNGSLAYDGGWYMDSFHGKGRIYNDAPQELETQFNYKNMNFIDEYWEVYDGEFFNEKKNGNGKLKLSNGQVFVGEFRDDKVNGEGRFYQLNGNVVHGVWMEGILAKVYE